MVPMAPARAGCWAQLGCCISAAAAPRVSVDPARAPALPLGGLSSSKASGFPAHLGSILLGQVSNSTREPAQPQIFPVLGARLWAACTITEKGNTKSFVWLIVPDIWETSSGLGCGIHPQAAAGGCLQRGSSLGPRGGRAGGAAFGASSSQQLFSRGLAEAGLAVPLPPAFYLNKLSSVQQPPLHGVSPTRVM